MVKKVKVSKVYSISRVELFQAIQKLFLNDYEKYTRRKLLKEEIKSGLKYTMTFGDELENKAQVLLKEYEEPRLYETEIQSNRGNVRVRYKLTEFSEEETELSYVEEMEATDRFSKMNHYIIKFFMKRKLKKKMEMTLDQLYKIALKLNREE